MGELAFFSQKTTSPMFGSTSRIPSCREGNHEEVRTGRVALFRVGLCRAAMRGWVPRFHRINCSSSTVHMHQCAAGYTGPIWTMKPCQPPVEIVRSHTPNRNQKLLLLASTDAIRTRGEEKKPAWGALELQGLVRCMKTQILHNPASALKHN